VKRTLAAFAVLVLVALVGACQPSPPERAAASDDPLAGSYRLERNGWIFVHLQGPPSRLGYQHGQLLAPEIDDLLRVLKPFLQKTSDRDWAFYRQAAERMLWPKIDVEFQQELDGIVAGATARGVKLDRWDLVALNALEELPSYYVPWLDKREGRTAKKNPGSCSALIATGTYTADGGIVVAHNNWTNYAVGSRWNVIYDLVPASGHRILMDGLPGVIASDDDFGMNANGIVITETTITGFSGFDPEGTPEFFRARKALQYSNTIDDYVRTMRERNNGGYANDWLVGDTKTGEIALFELGLLESSVRRTKDGYFVGANFPVDPKLIAAETTFDVSDRASSPNARKARWAALIPQYKGRIDVEVAKRLEADAYDAYEKKDGPNERSLCGTVDTSPRGIPEWDWAPFYPGGTVQAKAADGRMVSAMEMWAAMGHPCAPDFVAETFLTQHPEWGWMRGLLRDMKTQPWTRFVGSMK
jgi:hypothetical protein